MRRDVLEALKTKPIGPLSSPEQLATTRQRIEERRKAAETVRELNRAEQKAYDAELKERNTRRATLAKFSTAAVSFFRKEKRERLAIIHGEAIAREADRLLEKSQNPQSALERKMFFEKCEEQSIRTQALLEQMAVEKEASERLLAKSDLLLAEIKEDTKNARFFLSQLQGPHPQGLHFQGTRPRDYCKRLPPLPDEARGIASKDPLPPLKMV